MSCGCEQHPGSQCEDCASHETGTLSPISVSVDNHVSGTMRTEPMAADYAAYSTYSFTGTATDQPIRLLGRDENRSRAVIQVDEATKGIFVGKKEQIYMTGQGWNQKSGMSPLEMRNKQELWAMSNGVAVNVMVMNERWEQ